MEEEIAQELATELETRLTQETERLEGRMQEDLELAVARKREELQTSILNNLDSEYGERLSLRKQRLKERFDVSFSHAIDEIDRALHIELEDTVRNRIDAEFEQYKVDREAEITQHLSQFRHDRELDLRGQLDSQYEEKRGSWVSQIESEFAARQQAAERQIMAEIDSRIRNQRIAHETNLDLIKQETSLDLEVEMEAELAAFRAQKEREVAEQLDRQVAKREEIMRNKALIEVRRKESEIRAEIEAQLAIKRAEIRDRLNQLETRAEEFRVAAEEKLRIELEKGLITEEDLEAEAELKRAEEAADLEGKDGRIDRRQAWMDALAGAKGQMPSTAAGATPALGQPSASLGSLARPGGLGSPKQSDSDAPKTLAAPVRSPIQRTGGLGAPSSSALGKPVTPAASSGLAALKPVRQPIQAPKPLTPAPEPMSEEEFDTEPEVIVEDQPSLTKTILNAISEEESDPVIENPSEETPDFTDVMKPSRGPPGGGRLVRDGSPAKPAAGPPTKGPPVLESELPSEEEENSKLPTLAPILQPVRKPIAVDSSKSESVVLKPIGRTVLKPISESPLDEEE